jgi:predicted ATPase
LHDRCQQAAYKLIPEDQRAALRLRIGRSILQHTPEEEVDQTVTDIVEHFNAGYSLMEDPQEIEKVINLNLSAAQKAKLNTAYESAVKYMSVAQDMLRLLQERTKIDNWEHNYDLSVSIYLLYCECFYLYSRFDEADLQITEGLAHVKPEDIMERAKFLHIRQFIYIAQSNF